MPDAVTLVTGAAGALGMRLAKDLLACGDCVILVDQERQRKSLEALEAAHPGRLQIRCFDAASEADWAGVVPELESQFGPIAGCALIAGGWAGGGTVYETDVLDSMLTMNLRTVNAALRAVLPSMVSRAEGAVVVVGSRAAERPWESAGAAAYASAKAGVVALAQAAAAEVLPKGVRINAVLPSIIATAANRQAMPGADASRWVSTESLSHVIRFLLSDAARDISGAALPVYGRV